MPLVLYVYKCQECKHVGEARLWLVTVTMKEASTCAACGADVTLEWDGGVQVTEGEEL